MSAVVPTFRRGRKHRCAACGAAFYDLERELSACPKCETPYAAPAHMPRGESGRKRQSWNRSPRRAEPEPGAVPEAPAAEAAEEDNENVPLLDAADDEDADGAEKGDAADEAAEGDDA